MGHSESSRRVRPTHLLVSFAFLAMGFAAYFLYFWPAFETRLLYRHVPAVWLVPTQLRDNTMSAAAGGTLPYLGYKFEIPWGDLDTANVKASGNVAIIPFRSGLTVAFLTHSPREFVDNLTKSGPIKRQQFCQIHGDGACESDFAFERMMLCATPANVGFFTSRQERGRMLYLLMLKMASVGEPSGIFTVQTKEFHGFQFGDAQSARATVVDELYGENATLEASLVATMGARWRLRSQTSTELSRQSAASRKIASRVLNF